MIKRLFFPGLILGFIVSSSTWALAQHPDIRVEVAPPKNQTIKLFSLPPDPASGPVIYLNWPYENTAIGKTTVVVTITNMTGKYLTLHQLGCRDDNTTSWKTDSKTLVPSDCDGRHPFSIPITIKPGEVYKEEVPLAIYWDQDNISSEDITLRLGQAGQLYTSNPEDFTSETENPVEVTFWSNELTFHTKVVSQKNRKKWHALRKWFENFEKQQDMAPERDGVYKRFYYTGELYDERSFKRGTLNGPYKKFYRNGKIKETGNYTDGILTQPTEQ